MTTHQMPAPMTAEEIHRLRHLDAAVADLAQIVAGHRASCTFSTPGVCIGEADHILRQVPPAVWYDMLASALVRLATTPPYVHRLLDAFISGDPLNLEGAGVPDDVRDRLDAAVAEHRIGQVTP